MGLRDKASKIDFGSIGLAPVGNPDAKQPKTAPGAMMAYANDQRSELLKENEDLRSRANQANALEAQLKEAVHDLQAWDGAKPTRLLDPACVTPSAYANRHATSFVGPEFELLKREIADAGMNVQPIKVRAIATVQGKATYEIVFGHRRHEACSQLGLPVLAMVDNLDDRTLFVEMDRENRARADLSPWEQGMMYARALDLGLFASARQLAAAIGVDASNLGKALALARLPAEVVAAFASPLDLQYRWVPSLNAAVQTDLSGLSARAAKIAIDRGSLTAKQIIETLLDEGRAAGGGTVPPPDIHALLKAGKKVGNVSFGLGHTTQIDLQMKLNAAAQKQLVLLINTFLDDI